MIKSTKRIIAIATVIMIVFTLGANAASVNGKYITSAGACVMDYDTGAVLYEYNGYARRVPASMTKLLNLYCVYDALANGEIALDTRVPITPNVYAKSRNKLYQNMVPLNYNEVYTVDEVMNVVILYSASAAAVSLAELVGGSESAFVARMNAKAKSLGVDAVFYDSCGVADNSISPIGMATIARCLIRDYPDILTRSSRKSMNFHGMYCTTTNHLLDTYYYRGADGLKTGTGTAAGNCFCGTAYRDGVRLITVTMGSSSAAYRFLDTQILLDYGFSVSDNVNNTIYYTNIRTFIDGNEVPTFIFKGNNPHAVVIAEDLTAYGFDASYDSAAATLYLEQNKNKTANPIPMDIYRNKNNMRAFRIAENSNIKVCVKGNYINDIYNINGYMCISADALGEIFSASWNGADAIMDIMTK